MESAPAAERPYCSDLSLQADEPLMATALHTTHLILLEYNQAWQPKALEESELPAAVKQRLLDHQQSHPTHRVLFLRGARSERQRQPRLFVARLTEGETAINTLLLEGYDQILDLDLEALLTLRGHPPAEPWPHPLYLVCTHGRRDRCCARHGIAVYEALSASLPASNPPWVWQSSHVGGHRFAANVLFLPYGLLYGRLTPQSVSALLQAHAQGEILLDHLRGRMAYPPLAQAAEIALRRQYRLATTEALRLLQWTSDRHTGQALFMEQTTQHYYVVDVRRESTSATVYESCSLEKALPVPAYHFTVRRYA